VRADFQQFVSHARGLVETFRPRFHFGKQMYRQSGIAVDDSLYRDKFRQVFRAFPA